MNRDENKELFDKIKGFVDPMLIDPTITAEKGIAIASFLIHSAAEIFVALGGRNLAAQQFYAAADHYAAPKEPVTK